MNMTLTFCHTKNENGYLSQWYPCSFIYKSVPSELLRYPEVIDKIRTLDSIKYVSSLQFMMMSKALLFNDLNIYRKMRVTNDGKTLLQLGRCIAKFDKKIWDKYSTDIITIGTYLKFTQNITLQDLLLYTGDKLIVDTIDVKCSNDDVYDRVKWKGSNTIGFCLMKVRECIKT
jgi:ribA/ribD-fused uncharacterized protein